MMDKELSDKLREIEDLIIELRMKERIAISSKTRITNLDSLIKELKLKILVIK
jgi:hypothetical protein